MRRLFRAEESGLTTAALRWGERHGQWRRAARAVYASGSDPLTRLDVARAQSIATDAVARGGLAGVLHDLDSVSLAITSRRLWVPPCDRLVVIEGIRCADGLVTLVDIAASVDDLVWEQALESALRKKLTTIAEIEGALPDLSAARVPGVARMRRVLALRPLGAPATESLLETLMVQLCRTVPELPELDRQVEVRDEYEHFVARVDLAEVALGFFLELDGQQHRGQPVYDARRETAVVAATGWLPGRFTWTEVTRLPNNTARRVAALVRRARRRVLF